jgi:hypothetical protein
MFRYGVERQSRPATCPSPQAGPSPCLWPITKALQFRSVQEGQCGRFLGQNWIMFSLDREASSSSRLKGKRVGSTWGQDDVWSLCCRCWIRSTSLPNRRVRPCAGRSRSDLRCSCHGLPYQSPIRLRQRRRLEHPNGCELGFARPRLRDNSQIQVSMGERPADAVKNLRTHATGRR